MAKVKPAGVINVGLESDMKAVLTPPISVVLPAKLFTITVKTKATMFDHLSRAELFAAVFTLSQFYFRFFTYKRFSDQATWFFLFKRALFWFSGRSTRVCEGNNN